MLRIVCFLILGALPVLAAEEEEKAPRFRISRVEDAPSLKTETLRVLGGRQVVPGQPFAPYYVEKAAIISESDIRSVRRSEKPGQIEIELRAEGVKRLAEATEGAKGDLRLAVVVDGSLLSVPLVAGPLSGAKLSVPGFENFKPAALEEVLRFIRPAE